MTTPEVPLRMELTFELPGTPEQVWHALATAEGMSAWFIPSDVEGCEGGSVAFHMGDTASEGSISAWDPPRRLEYVEPDWAELAGQEPASVTPLVSEFLVEARSGGTCVVRVVSSAFGTGADWEREFFAGMEKGWSPHFDNLRLYLTRFPGQTATYLEAAAQLRGPAEGAWATLQERLGTDSAGVAVDVLGLRGEVYAVRDEAAVVDIRHPLPGYVLFNAMSMDDDSAFVMARGYFFSDDAPAYVERERPAWRAWLEALGEPATPVT